ncbi:hypothetical protein ACFP3P_22605, partial [Pelomonas aquatica]
MKQLILIDDTGHPTTFMDCRPHWARSSVAVDRPPSRSRSSPGKPALLHRLQHVLDDLLRIAEDHHG